MNQRILTNARIVTPDEVVAGTLTLRNGTIVAIDRGPTSVAGARDLEGDWLLPGFVELHTDNLERQFSPRPGVRWPSDLAILQHDAQVAAAGITTVCDAVACGFYSGKRERADLLQLSLDVLHHGRAARALKSDHYLHLRLELADPGCVDLFEPLAADPTLRLVSFMDHTPGQRQWHDIAKFRQFHLGRTVRDEDEFQAMVQRRQAEQLVHTGANLERLLALLDGHPAVRASHDDTLPEHVAEGLAMGVTIAEFPTTRVAAGAARAAGMGIVMGAPNLVLGGSHSGNVDAVELARAGLLDVLSSDYVPASLVQAAFRLVREEAMPMPQAAAMISATPARLLGLADRGSVRPGLRADLVRIREVGHLPQIQAVWSAGARIA